MKRLLAFIILLIAAVTMSAQTSVINQNMTHDGSKVTVTFEVDTDKSDIPSQRKEVILPYIYNGKDTLFLEVLEIYSKGRFKRERQEYAIAGDSSWGLSSNQTLQNEGIYSYVAQVPLKRWMKNAVLGIRRQMVGCACEKEISDENIAQASLFEEPKVQRLAPEYHLAEISRNWDFGQDELEIIFKVSRIEIDSTVFNNEITFGKILDAVDKIYSNPHYKVDKIEVAGYASPEGTRKFNNWLGENRAKALIDYIMVNRPQYGLTESNFFIRNGEENWEGLRRHLLQSSIEERDQVVAIIDSQLSDEKKKVAIKSLDEGKVWKKMLDQIYPHLRCARYKAVYYDSTDDKAVELIRKADSLINDGDYVQAYGLLMQVSDDMRAYNSIGVTLMMQLKFEEAMPWLQKALEHGCLTAQKNIDAINAAYASEEQQRKDIEEYLKKYE